MHLFHVDSSMIAAAGYDPETRLLVVLFNSGKAYEYAEVPPQVFFALMAADSKGRFMNDNVIGFYPYAPFNGWRSSG